VNCQAPACRNCPHHKHFLIDNWTVGEVDFWIFNFLQFVIDGKNNSKTKVEEVFSLLSCLPMRK
jgi:hypothetical protein